MKKLWLVFAILVWGSIPVTRADNEGGALPPLPGMTATFRNPARNDAIVFTDGVSKRYHRAGCRLLGDSRYSMGKKTAAYNGYAPCRECWNN